MPEYPIDLDLSLTAEDFEGGERATFMPFEQRWDGEGPMPVIQVHGTGGVPHLREIHPALWGQVLAPLDKHRRRYAAASGGLTMPEADALRRLLDALPKPVVVAVTGAGTGLPKAPRVEQRRPTRQLNMRLLPDEYEELEAAAALVGAKPTQLGRMLVLTGVRSVLAQHGPDYVATRR